MHSAWPLMSTDARGERFPHAVHAKSQAWMHANSMDPVRPAASGAGAKGALHTLQECRASGAMIPHPGHMRTP